MRLTTKQIRIFSRIQKKHNVSIQFLKSNISNIHRFLYYVTSSRSIIKTIASRKMHSNRVFIKYGHLRRAVWNKTQRNRIKARKRCIKEWSKRMVMHLRVKRGVQEYVEESSSTSINLRPEEVSQKLKEQLELLRSGKRTYTPFIQTNPQSTVTTCETITNRIEHKNTLEHYHKIVDENNQSSDDFTSVRSIAPPHDINSNRKQKNSGAGIVNEKDINNATAPTAIKKNIFQSVPVENSKNSKNFLDMLMNKVGVSLNVENNYEPENESHTSQSHFISIGTVEGTKKSIKEPIPRIIEMGQLTDSSDDFLGFDEDNDRLPGMLITPRVPFNNMSKSSTEHVAFVSESLDKYMRENALMSEEEAISQQYETIIDDKKITRKFRQANHDGLVTLACNPPQLEMPVVPETLQRLRTVAERRQYLQRFSKNHKLAIINNEAMIYRELQRKMKPNKIKYISQHLCHVINSQMPFTRSGWQAAAFVITEYNRYYYQKLEVYTIDNNIPFLIKLPGVYGNNEEFYKRAIRLNTNLKQSRCHPTCIDALLSRKFKTIKTIKRKAKLNKVPLKNVIKPCPLSQKPFQKPLDDETAALLLAGGSMAVVRMPTVELEIFPQLGKPLHDIAKRYLQYILPHHDITREWAEFSVSTLQQPHTMKEAEAIAAEATKSQNGGHRRKSFAFAIPYLNDRNQILVRRVVDRSEKLDISFELAQSCNDDITISTSLDLSFRAKINVNDQVQLACANVVTDLINCVAISCSENSFIKDDPDNIYDCAFKDTCSINCDKTPNENNTAKKIEASKKNITHHKKQNRLLMELRRLNATIIDAGTKAENGTMPCHKSYCVLGCVCNSLADDMPLRQHCGKSKCVLECNCKYPNQARIMRLETDGRFITTEDAFMLRRKATARLARMEKEFTSTVVLRGNETLFINESQYDKKRRCTKAPRRYEDFAETDDDYARITPSKKLTTGAVVETSPNTCFTDYTTELHEPILVHDYILNELKHCSVVLTPLRNLKNLAVWCMIHELYNCFCGGRAIEGKPLHIEKDDINGTDAHANNITQTKKEHLAMTHSKTRYSFEKSEKRDTNKDELLHNIEKHQNGNSEERNDIDKQDDELDTSFHITHKQNHGRKRKHLPCDISTSPIPLTASSNISTCNDVIESYFKATPYTCRRCVMVPGKIYLDLNRKRSAKIHEYIEKMENAKTRLLLNEHILRSVYYHKHEIECQRREESKKEYIKQKNALISGSNISRVINDDGANLITFKEDDLMFNFNPYKITKRRRSADNNNISTTTFPEKRSKQIHLQDRSIGGENVGNLSDFIDLTENFTNSPKEIIPDPTAPSDVRVPKITSCFSMYKPKTNVQIKSSIDTQSTSSANCELDKLKITYKNLNNNNFRDFYNTIITNMNNLVSKKMQDIDLALRRESKIIPVPNEEILCIIKWKNFLDAYQEGFVYIWEVKMRDHSFFAATVNKQLPMVVGALGVVNITTLSEAQLPLMGYMLTQQCHSETTRSLAIVMQGRSTFWLVRGFLRADSTQACVKPTPQSHPLLTTKINLLCSLLIKQRMKEYKRKSSFGPVLSKEQPCIRPKEVNANAHQTDNAANSANSQYVLNSSETIVRKLNSPSYNSMQTNIRFRKLRPNDIEEIHPPEYHEHDHRWLVLDLHNDFSHIFVPDFRDLVSLDRIHKVMAFSQQHQKIVKLQFFKNAPYDAFVTPNSLRKLYFGPLKVTERPPVLILLQSVDGHMMLRELYQRRHNIKCNPHQQTCAMWILQIKGKIQFEFHAEYDEHIVHNVVKNKIKSNTTQTIVTGKKIIECDNNNSDTKDCVKIHNSDDEDCVIIESSTQTKGCELNENETAKLSENPMDYEFVTNGSNRPNVASLHQQEVKTLPKMHRINFTIQNNDEKHQSQITPLPSNTSITFPLDSLKNTNKLPAPHQKQIDFIPLMNTNNAVTPTVNKIKTVPEKYVVIANSLNTTMTGLPLSSNGNNNIGTTVTLKTNYNDTEPIPKHTPKIKKPFAKRRRTLFYDLPNSPGGKKMNDQINSNVSTIGTTTITKLTGEFKSTSNGVYNTDNSKLRPIASITIAKIHKGKDINASNLKSARCVSNAITPNTSSTSNTLIMPSNLTSNTVSDTINTETYAPKNNSIVETSVSITKHIHISTPSKQSRNTISNIDLDNIKTIELNTDKNSTIQKTTTDALNGTSLSTLKLKKSLSIDKSNDNDSTLKNNFDNTPQHTIKVRPIIRIRSATRKSRVPSIKITEQQTATPKLKSLLTSTTLSNDMALNIHTGDETVIHPKTNIPKTSVRKVNYSDTPIIESGNKEVPVSYGYFHSNLPGSPKFVVRRQDETFLVKIRDVGIIQIQTEERVNAYLNRHLAKIQPNLASFLPTLWKFVSQNKITPQQTPIYHKTEQQPVAIENETHKNISLLMTPITERKIIPCTANKTAAINNIQQKEDCIASNHSTNDTIIIE